MSAHDLRIDTMSDEELTNLVQRRSEHLAILNNELTALIDDFKLFLKRVLFWMNDRFTTNNLLKPHVCLHAFDLFQELLVERRDAGRRGEEFFTDVGENHPVFDEFLYP
ncbi:hypothetical protein ACFE04_001998 [Oxalis oulophora]